MNSINWNKLWDLLLFAMAGALIYGFVNFEALLTAEKLALILFGAFMKSIGERT